MQAGLLRVKLKHLEADTLRRQAVALAYAKGIKSPALAQPIAAKSTLESIRNHVFHLYVIRSTKRDALQSRLTAAGIQTMIHYPIPAHLQTAYKEWNCQKYPLTEAIHDQVFSLPVSPVMDKRQVEKVIDIVNSTSQSL
jgi:dTDP-4-amino-4,6-dideoxygalactose transaminase